MALRWSSELHSEEHKDLQASTMAMDRNGDNILLAGKRHIAIKNLNRFSQPLKKYSKNSKYDVGRAEWNPTALNGHFCSISINQKIEIFSWKETDLDLFHVLKFHTRLICDLNWHQFDPNLLASASADSFTYVWDLRDLRRPCISFSAIAAANHVRWNKLTAYLLATAHDGDIRIWDQRKGTAPVQYLSPHVAKIHDLDWSQTHEFQLASCSQDGTVKFFDVTNPNCAESVIQTASPVWRARYTPFGEGLVTVVIPLSQRGENGLLLWNLSNLSIPVHTFVGHTDIILEFEWRKNRNEISDYQLVTWSKDQSLRVWKIEPFLQKLCGYDLDRDSLGLAEELNSEGNNVDIELSSQDPKEFSAVETIIPAVEAMNEISFSNFDYFQYPDKYYFSSSNPSKSLELEFSLLTANFTNLPNVKFEEMNVLDRICIVTVIVNSYTVTLKITFPSSYPTNAAPSFQLDDSSPMDDMLKTKILRLLKQTAQQRVKKNRICLESCLNQLITTLEHSVQIQEIESKSPSRVPTIGSAEAQLLPTNSFFYEAMHDIHIPYPKTCGARFCSVDKLVCFYQSSFARKMITRPDTPTPRSFSAVVGNVTVSSVPHSMIYMLQNSTGQDVTDGSVSCFIQERNLNRPRTLRNVNFPIVNGSQIKSLKNVTIYDCSKLFFTNKELAEKYVLDLQNITKMCNRNAEVAEEMGRPDLVQVWILVGLIGSSISFKNNSEDDMQWFYHPFFKSQIEYLIMHYAKMSDIQTAAMLSCIFAPCKPEQKDNNFNKSYNKTGNVTPGGSPYHTIHPIDTTSDDWTCGRVQSTRHNRSNSWSDSLDDLKAIIINTFECANDSTSNDRSKFLNEKNAGIYDELKRHYADILHRWNLLESRTQVGKFLQHPKDSIKLMEFLMECQQCKKPITRPPYCSSCKKIVLRCSVCRILVRGTFIIIIIIVLIGSSNFCFACGHGGHAKHIFAWFSTENYCPTNCGCRCASDHLNCFEC
ncbi:conserved hypothetical protein [Pediculus humanus corporis]|uniref:RWD domain-containing protein n=1 Tax=Pediculus humanus subsp. corporis TaxID=121224 RepID=E0VY62_PEDHC|nr:uncharacterized protein Phum_PHUM509530 [Pediculus humanus corporis]EEB18318.1 conserved hypothetical protein [Pediculus humanus corporis]